MGLEVAWAKSQNECFQGMVNTKHDRFFSYLSCSAYGKYVNNNFPVLHARFRARQSFPCSLYFHEKPFHREFSMDSGLSSLLRFECIFACVSFKLHLILRFRFLYGIIYIFSRALRLKSITAPKTASVKLRRNFRHLFI